LIGFILKKKALLVY